MYTDGIYISTMASDIFYYRVTCVDYPIKINHNVIIRCRYFIPERLYSLALMLYAMIK